MNQFEVVDAPGHAVQEVIDMPEAEPPGGEPPPPAEPPAPGPPANDDEVIDMQAEDGDFFQEAEPDAAAEPTVQEQHFFLDQAKRHLFKEEGGVMELLTKTPALINVQPLGRWSALHHAAEAREADVVEFLLARGADRHARTSTGRRALQVARSDEVRALLAEVGGPEECTGRISIKWRWDVPRVPRGPLPLLAPLSWSKTYSSFMKAAESFEAFRASSDANRVVLCRVQVAEGREELVFRTLEAAARGMRDLGGCSTLQRQAPGRKPSKSAASARQLGLSHSQSVGSSYGASLAGSVGGSVAGDLDAWGGAPVPEPLLYDNLEAVGRDHQPPFYPPGRPSGRCFEPPFEAIIGEGVFGKVWRAKDQASGTIFAVKNVKKVGSSASMRECDIANLICDFPHPCVVELLLVHDFATYYSVVMEFCGGGDLLAKVDHQRKTTGSGARYVAPALSRPWLGQVFLGLEHLHLNVGMLLRDLKPDNVVLNGAEHAKLTDFGFSREGTQAKGMTFGHPTGTPGYASPEVLKGQKHDCKADLYSYGVLVWLVLAGGISSEEEPQPPTGEMLHQQHYRALFDDWKKLVEAASLRNISPSFDADARDLVLKLVTDTPAKRPDHAHIRAHPLLEPLDLPRRLEGPQAVLAWLGRLFQP